VNVSPASLAYSLSGGRWYPAEHLLLLDEALVQVAAGEIKNLMVFMPPRHGKSELTSKFFPTWYLSRFPDKRVILTSYEADFASSWGYKVRSLIQEHGPTKLGIEIAPNSSARDRWDILGHYGGMMTAGVGGAITGKGADLLIIDDPVKNAEQAQSKRLREKTLDWYKSTAYTRLEPGGAVVVIQTRWHDADLSGALLEDEGHKWKVINLPALAGLNDPLGRKPGEALFRQRFDEAALADIKETLGPYWWAALYQQTPQDEEGAIFKTQFFQYATLTGGVIDLGERKYLYDDCEIFQTCDPAATKSSKADYFVLATWAKTPENDLVLLDLLRLRLESPDQVKLFWQQFRKWRPASQWVETVGAGKILYQFLDKEGLPVKELKPGTRDKVTRAIPAAARMAAGRIYFRAGAPWIQELEDELLAFPNGTHDDQVDNVSYAFQVMIESKRKVKKFSYSKMSKGRKKL
jgi:predicted phage terminase large subunit-like protein